ncbi:universal stress protein [Oceanicaulis sp. MMSF_3324]|uniref:universal stress protein n=1 Tax=Oceanicaulis sp. MMSF_3324 TaxID=3046702 RepID=UPI00273D13A2|nr:universal stress protein [Oceanicaulis sp. MMSF_3324]
MSAPRKFLLIADGTEESRSAAYFAARRARNTGGVVTVLAVVNTEGGFEHWLGVGETMRAEARAAAEEALESLSEDVEEVTETRPEVILKEGELIECLRALLESDTAISILVLGAAVGKDGPGPLVNAVGRGKGLFEDRSIPVTVVPGNLSREDIKALT